MPTTISSRNKKAPGQEVANRTMATITAKTNNKPG